MAILGTGTAGLLKKPVAGASDAIGNTQTAPVQQAAPSQTGPTGQNQQAQQATQQATNQAFGQLAQNMQQKQASGTAASAAPTGGTTTASLGLAKSSPTSLVMASGINDLGDPNSTNQAGDAQAKADEQAKADADKAAADKLASDAATNAAIDKNGPKNSTVTKGLAKVGSSSTSGLAGQFQLYADASDPAQTAALGALDTGKARRVGTSGAATSTPTTDDMSAAQWKAIQDAFGANLQGQLGDIDKQGSVNARRANEMAATSGMAAGAGNSQAGMAQQNLSSESLRQGAINDNYKNQISARMSYLNMLQDRAAQQESLAQNSQEQAAARAMQERLTQENARLQAMIANANISGNTMDANYAAQLNDIYKNQ